MTVNLIDIWGWETKYAWAKGDLNLKGEIPGM